MRIQWTGVEQGPVAHYTHLGLGRVEILYLDTRDPITHWYPGTHYHSILGMTTVRKYTFE